MRELSDSLRVNVCSACSRSTWTKTILQVETLQNGLAIAAAASRRLGTDIGN